MPTHWPAQAEPPRQSPGSALNLDQAGSQQRKIVLGTVTGFYGIKGWIRVFSATEPRENIVNYPDWWLRKTDQTPGQDDDWQQVKVVEGRRHGKTVVASIAGIESRTAAQSLQGRLIAVERNQLPATDAGEYYWADLVGCRVVDSSGATLGWVERLFSTGANDVVVVRTGAVVQTEGTAESGAASSGAASGTELLIPWIMHDVILEVDTAGRRLRVDWDVTWI